MADTHDPGQQPTPHGGVPDLAPVELVEEVAGPAAAKRPSVWKQVFLVFKVVEVRLRFIAILVAVGLFIGYWDTVKNYWDKWTRVQGVAVRQLAADQEFFCPMHPNVVRSTYEPNGDVPKCPICGMPLSIRRKGQKEALPPGVTGRVQLTPERIQLAGIRTENVVLRPVSKQTTTVGYVSFDESRLSRVVTRVKGYVEVLYVDKTYVTVREGEPLAEIYSPELYSTAQELLIALKHNTGGDLVDMARDRLRLFGVSNQEIDEIVRSRSTRPRLVIRSPQSGYVIGKKIVVGSSVEPGMTLLEVADLSKVWIEADVYEKDVAFLEPGQPVVATVEAYPDTAFHGRLALVYPELDTATRTNRVRFELDNPEHKLRPGMFATVRINTPLQMVEPYKSLAASQVPVVLTSAGSAGAPPPVELPVVSERAVVDTGAKKIVYVEREPGLFEGVEVELGPRVQMHEGSRTVDYYPVLKGLKPGDEVAAAGSFLIDAETRLNPAAASSYFGASGGPQSSARGGSTGGSSSGTSSGAGSSPGPQSPAGQPQPKPEAHQPTAGALKNLAQLPEADRRLALKQRVCPITGAPLGAMGVPFKITLRGHPVFLCCKGCAAQAKRDPDGTLKKIAASQPSHSN